MLIKIYGNWNDDGEPLEKLCKVDARCEPEHSDHDQWLAEQDEDYGEIFYYLSLNEPILGNWGDITVNGYEIVKENENA